MNIQMFAKPFLFACVLLLSFNRSTALYSALEKGDEKYTGNSETELLRYHFKMREEFPEYAKIAYSMELPFSNQGILIDSKWIIGDYSAAVATKGPGVFTLGFLYEHSENLPGNLLGKNYFGPRAKFAFAPKNACHYRQKVFLAHSSKPIQNIYSVGDSVNSETIERIAPPFKRNRGIDLGNDGLYFVSSIATDEGGDLIPLERKTNFLGFARCSVGEGQDLSADEVMFDIEVESMVESKTGDDYKLTVHCSPKDIGGLILMRVKDTEPNEGQYQLVGIVTSVEDDSSVRAVLCNQNLNSWIDSKVVMRACEPTL